jgi:hypothetical protein
MASERGFHFYVKPVQRRSLNGPEAALLPKPMLSSGSASPTFGPLNSTALDTINALPAKCIPYRASDMRNRPGLAGSLVSILPPGYGCVSAQGGARGAAGGAAGGAGSVRFASINSPCPVGELNKAKTCPRAYSGLQGNARGQANGAQTGQMILYSGSSPRIGSRVLDRQSLQ